MREKQRIDTTCPSTQRSGAEARKSLVPTSMLGLPIWATNLIALRATGTGTSANDYMAEKRRDGQGCCGGCPVGDSHNFYLWSSANPKKGLGVLLVRVRAGYEKRKLFAPLPASSDAHAPPHTSGKIPLLDADVYIGSPSAQLRYCRVSSAELASYSMLCDNVLEKISPRKTFSPRAPTAPDSDMMNENKMMTFVSATLSFTHPSCLNSPSPPSTCL